MLVKKRKGEALEAGAKEEETGEDRDPEHYTVQSSSPCRFYSRQKDQQERGQLATISPDRVR